MSERCVLCDVPLIAYGHNPEPLAEGRCCTSCNDTLVIPARLAQLPGNRGGEKHHPDDDPLATYVDTDKPVDRLTRIADSMIKAMEAHAEARDDDKAIIFVDDDERGGIAIHGYEKVSDAIVDLLGHLEVLFKSIGKEMNIAFIPEDASELVDE